MACESPALPLDSHLPGIPTNVTVDALTRACDTSKEQGVYDKLMQAFQCSIDDEYKKQRIKGTDYSKVYLGGMQTAMQQAMQFVLTKDKAALETELARYQILKTNADIALVNAQRCLAEEQLRKAELDTLLTKAQLFTELSKLNSNVQTGYENLRDKDKAPTIITGSTGAQIDKMRADIKLTNQKTTTELAQTTGGAADDESLIGRQKLVHKRQADGFLRNAEVAVAKIYSDAYAVVTTVNDEPPNSKEIMGIEPTKGKPQIDSALRTARCGVQSWVASENETSGKYNSDCSEQK